MSVEDLYKLPQTADIYKNLQSILNDITAKGAEYLAPTSGTNRQSVQLKDIDGDGINEAIAFFRMSGDSPLKIYLFKRNEDKFDVAAIIEGDGTSVESITYSDMDDDGVLELIVAWKMSAALKMLSVYSVRDFQPSQVINTDFSSYTTADLDKNGTNDLIVIRMASADSAEGTITQYMLQRDGEVTNTSARLSLGVDSLARLRVGQLSDKQPAVFVESVYDENSIVTDIFICQDEMLKNITASHVSGISDKTIRSYTVYATDINNDGVIEVPSPRQLESQTETTYRVIDWYVYSSASVKRLALTTYHNYSDGWYIIIPSEWDNNLTVRRSDNVSGERALVFSKIIGQKASQGDARQNELIVEDFLTVYTLSGYNKEERAKMSGRFVLLAESEVIYAAEISGDTQKLGFTVSRETVTDNFNIIYTDWFTGMT